MSSIGGTRGGGSGPVARLTTEAKQAFKTTEFWVFVAVVAGILIASAIIGDGGNNGNNGGDNAADQFPGVRAWLYVTIAAVGYMVSRGLAKSGSREPYWADRDDMPSGGSNT